jgi:hypothetical protein
LDFTCPRFPSIPYFSRILLDFSQNAGSPERGTGATREKRLVGGSSSDGTGGGNAFLGEKQTFGDKLLVDELEDPDAQPHVRCIL